MQSFLWVVIGAALAVVLVTVVVVLAVRRRRQGGAEASSVFPPSTAGGSGAQVRLLEGDDTARQARIDALRGEVTSLRREAAYAEQRGLDRRAQRLHALIAEREEQLREHDPAEDRAG